MRTKPFDPDAFGRNTFVFGMTPRALIEGAVGDRPDVDLHVFPNERGYHALVRVEGRGERMVEVPDALLVVSHERAMRAVADAIATCVWLLDRGGLAYAGDPRLRRWLPYPSRGPRAPWRGHWGC